MAARMRTALPTAVATLSWPTRAGVLRVWNAEVVENPNAVLFRIGEAVGVAWDPF